MAVLDIIILGAMAAGVIHGYRTGFFKQAGGIVGVLIGFALALNLMNPVGAYLVRISSIDPVISPIVGFIAVFAGTYLLVQIVARIGQEFLGAVKLTFVNRLLGGGVGGLKAALLVSIAFIGLAYVKLPPESTKQASSLYHSVAAIMPVAWSYVVENSQALDEISGRIEQVIPDDAEAGEGPESGEASN